MPDQTNLRRFDLNLLVIFQAILSQGSVAGAAEAVGLSPSAVSHALARLRVMFNDELFRRSPNGLEPTERALEVGLEIGEGLHHISTAIDMQQRFDPSKSDRVFTMQIADYVSGMVLAPLAQRLERDAPGISVNVIPFGTGADATRKLSDVQIMFAPEASLSAAIRTRRLLDDRFLVVMRQGHPAAREELTVERYAGLRHARISPAAIGTTLIDDALARRGLQRRQVLTVPSWFDLPQIIETTDLVAVVPSEWLKADSRLAALVARELPMSEVGFSVDLRWDARSDRDPGQKWFRDAICKIFADVIQSER
ncbi:LysR family transcriptional regulator [Thioclava atlantica]|uniref:LysR family transcriptional regulator n=1 Tax=Thioclava atlantica TaxID=1317124 RepID=A0A085TRN7_9RHOB|nr:LysR family transcriptional regulator [Thioclava atlantica]KFE33384.1 LysR family transcriptional regulator [Thioclava atlantica]